MCIAAGMKHTCVRAALALAAAVAAAPQSQVDLRTQAKNVDFSGAASTRPFRMGTTLPAACTPGEAFFKADAEPGRNWYACTAANTWTLQSGASLDSLSGDVTGAPAATRVGALQGRPVADAEPADGQVLRWNAGVSRWEPQQVAAANAAYAFTNQSTVAIPGATHGLATANLIVDCYDTAVPNARLEPAAVRIDPATYDLTVEFGTARSGRCVVNGSGGAGGVSATASNTFAGGTVQTFLGGLVASAAQRTAPAQAGTTLPPACTQGDQFFKTDAGPGENLYFCTGANTWTQMRAGPSDFSEISGTVTDAQIAAGVNAAKIGAGTVTNTAFGYLAGAASNIQAQLDGKAAASHSHTLGGDLAGEHAGATVTGIQGRPVAPAAPADGQALVWTGGMWQPGSGGGGGAAFATQLGDLKVQRTGATVLTIGSGCTMSNPCNVRFGNVNYNFTQSCTATLSAGTGAAYVYVASGGTLMVGHNLTLAASAGCTAQPGVTTFPAQSIPLYRWTATNGSWDLNGGTDQRAFLSLNTISAGMGMATVESGGRTTVSVDTAVVPTYLTAAATINVPAIAPGTCSADQVMALPGAVMGDAVAPGWPSSLPAGLTGTMRVSASDAVAVRLCNVSGSTIDPPGETYRALVLRSF